MPKTQTCLICGAPSPFLFQAQVLGRYAVDYFQCVHCHLIHTEKPYWLHDAYNEAVSSLDVGLVGRNLAMARQTTRVIERSFDGNGRFLDYAGGYGLFVRLMRDTGFDFYRDDLYCANIFAQHLDLVHADMHGAGLAGFELVTAFEVFEHMVDPLAEAEKLLKFSDSVLFSTELVPAAVRQVGDWWYFVPETGQHIVFFSLRALEVLAQKLGCQLFSNGADLHLMTRRSIANPFTASRKSFKVRLAEKVLRWVSPQSPPRTSLVQRDFDAARTRLQKSFTQPPAPSRDT